MEIPTKTCSKCKQVRPLTDFHRCRQWPDGLQYWCKLCTKQANHASYQRNKARVLVRTALYQKTHREVSRASTRRWASQHQDHIRAYRLVHIEHKREQNRQWQQANPEKIRAKSQRWRKRHPEKVRASNKHHRLANPAYHKAKKKEYYQRHPDKRKAKQAWDYAKKRGLESILLVRVTPATIYQRDGGRCHICKRQVPANRFTLDHLIPLSQGGPHTAENLAVACRSCNARRGPGRLPAQLRLLP